MTSKVTRLRRFLADHAFPGPSDAERKARRDFQLHEFNTEPPVVLDQSPAARAQREIARIASWYGWGAEVARQLDLVGAASVGELSLEAVEQLRDHMQRLERCAQDGCDPAEALPAR